MASDATSQSAGEAERVKIWETRWQQGETGFHMQNVHKMLTKHMDKLNPDSKLGKIFIPLCGKTVDMKWLAEQGLVTVGVEGVQQALDEFFAENGLEKSETSLATLGSGGKLLQTKDGMIRLYCGDMMQFSPSFEGTFDAMWDRGSLVALDREDVPQYVDILKNLLSVGGRLLVEVMEYTPEDMKDVDATKRPPPPHAMYQPEMKKLFEPQCTVDLIDRDAVKFHSGINLNLVYYLVVKK